MDESIPLHHNLPIGIIILHFRNLNDTWDCITSVRLAVPAPRKIVVINNSTSGKVSRELNYSLKEDPKVAILNTGQNLGYAGGMNFGIRFLMADDNLKVILLLNNDTVVEADFLGPLFNALSLGSGYHLATPKILHTDSARIWSNGERVFYPFLFDRSSAGKSDVAGCFSRKTINAITGCAMAVRREVFDRIGLFDERYFAYVEDVDFCLRANAAGFRFTCCPESVVYHNASSSLGDFSPAKVYLNVRNKAYFIRKNIHPIWWPLSWPWYLLTVLSWTFRALLKRKPDVVRAILFAGLDAISGRMGPPPQLSPQAVDKRRLLL